MKIYTSVQQFVVAVFMLCILLPVANAHASVAEFKKVHGVVDVFHKGERKASLAAVGAAINVGDTVRTGRRSRAQLKFSDGSVLNIGSLAKIQVGEFSFDADTKVRKSSIRNLRGKVRAAVSKSTEKESFFRIETPGAVAAVRGTNFIVAAISPKVTAVLTISGSVAVSNRHGPQQNNTVLVLANQVTYVVSHKAPSTPIKASAKVLGNMVSGTKQVDNKKSSKTKAKGKAKASAKSKSKSSVKGKGKTKSKSKAKGKANSPNKSSTTKSTKTASSKSKSSSSTLATSTKKTGAITTTKTTGTTTPSGVQTTTITTTTSASGSTNSVLTTSSVSSGSVANTASSAPIAGVASPISSAPQAPAPVVVIPRTAAPTTVQQIAPVVAVTPPITTTIPAVVQKTNVNVVIQF